MRAVNLIPEDLRGFSGAGGQTPTAVYGLLGALATLVLLVAALALTDRQIADRKAEIVQVEAESAAATARAAELAPYTTFAKLSDERVATVKSVAAGRFDWATALREVSRLVPEKVYLTSLVGTTAPGVSVEGGAGNPLRASLPVPALEIIGCAPSQRNIARLLPRLRAMRGVQRVSLASAEKSEAVGGGGGSGGAGGDCRQGSDRIPQFNLVIFFEPTAVPAAAAGTTTTAAAPATAAPASAPAPAAPAAPAPAAGAPASAPSTPTPEATR